MTRYNILLFTTLLLSCNQTNQTDTKTNISNLEKQESVLTEILLTETKLGALILDKLNESKIQADIKLAFPDFLIAKTVGKQDGPDFNLYQVTYSGQKIFSISMDSYDTSLVQKLWTSNKIIIDKYGISVGQKMEFVFEKRPSIKFHSDLHQNIYATEKNSKIEYRLTGDFKPLNDTTFCADDFSVEKWQTEGMEIEYIVWRK